MLLRVTRRFAANVKKQNIKSKNNPEEDLLKKQEEIQYEVPKLTKEAIHFPKTVVKLEKWGPNTTKDKLTHYYQLNDEYFEPLSKMFKLAPSIRKEREFFQRTAAMTRQVTFDLLESIKNKQNSALLGRSGCGKSLTLLQMTSYLHQEPEKFVFYAPHCLQWTHGLYAYQKNPETRLYEQPEATRVLLEHFLKMNEQKLSSRLVDLLKKGTVEAKNSIGVWNDFLIALKEEVDFVFALDGWNQYFSNSFYKDQNSQIIPNQQLKLVHDLTQFAQSKSVKGAVLLATTGKQENINSTIPNTFKQHQLPAFNIEETEEALMYYMRSGILPRDDFTNELVKKVFYLTEGVSQEIFDFCLKKPLLY